MQPPSWNDLRCLLAVSRAQSLSGAATLLGVNATTVSRRLKSLEDACGCALLHREQGGVLRLTQTGADLADQAEGMERHANLAQAKLGQSTVLGGTIRLTAVPFLLNRIVAPQIHTFLKAHPALGISLIPDNKNLSLTRREVDLALRFGEPHEGGDAILVQRLGNIGFSVYAARVFASLDRAELTWLTYDPITGHLPQAVWTTAMVKATGMQTSQLLMHDLETVFGTILGGPFCALLPNVIADRDHRLIRLHIDAETGPMFREVWLMRHRDSRGLHRIEAATKWLSNCELFD